MAKPTAPDVRKPQAPRPDTASHSPESLRSRAEPSASKEHTKEELDELLDESLDESFPASDPPAVHRRPD